MRGPEHVLIIGASAAGLSTSEALRRKGYKGQLTLVGDERHQPYDRPPLSKQVLQGAWEPERAALRSADGLAALDLTFVLGDAAVGLDAASRTVRTASGRDLSADAVVIATGVQPRRLRGQAGLAGVHVMRTLEDSLALKQELVEGARLVVVGEGVLGSEIAATARLRGVDVTLVGPLAAPMAGQVGPLVSELLAEVHAEQGVRLRLGVGVDDLSSHEGRVTGVRLMTGEELPADVVVVAIGSSPATDWLADSGLHIDNGVVCDAYCKAADGVYAVGDVARWQHQGLGRLVRFENRTNATEQALAVAATILGEGTPYIPVPYFWTDQYNVKIQVFGMIPPGADAEIVEGTRSERRFVARYTLGGTVTGALGWNMPKQVRMHRQEVAAALAATPPIR